MKKKLPLGDNRLYPYLQCNENEPSYIMLVTKSIFKTDVHDVLQSVMSVDILLETYYRHGVALARHVWLYSSLF